MWPFDTEEELPPEVTEFRDVAAEISEISEDSESGLLALQDLYSSYQFEEGAPAKDLFVEASDNIRKKFGETKAFSYEESLEMAPINMSEIVVEAEDEEERKLELINKWEEQNLKNLEETSDLGYLQGRSQLSRGIKEAATLQRREYYGSDNYLVTDLALRFGQGAVGPIAELAGADSVTDFFKEQTDPDRDDSYWSAIASGAGSGVAAVSAGVAGGPLGVGAYLGASGAGAVRGQVEDALEAEATVGEALTAGGIEAVNQTVQAGVGVKVFGGVAKKITGDIGANLGARIFPRIAGNAALEGTTEAAGQVVSNVASNIGQSTDEDIFQGVAQSGVAGFVVGGAASGVGEYASSRRAPSPDAITVKAYRGSKDDPSAPGVGGGQFFSADESVAKAYAGEDGSVIEETVTFNQPLKAQNWMEAKKDLDLPKSATMETLIETAAEKGYDGIVFEAHNGKPEYVKIDPAPDYKEKLEKEGVLEFPESNNDALKAAQESQMAALKDQIEALEGTPPPPAESIPAGRQSVDLEGAGTLAMTLTDGSEIVESDGLFHLKKNDKTLEAYQAVKYVTPDVAKHLQNLTQRQNPDGTAITLTLNEKGQLVTESDFVTSDLSINAKKTNSRRVAVPVEENAEGNVPVFVSQTRTTGGVRQNPFMIAPGAVDKSASAAAAGFGGQREPEGLTDLRFKYGPEASEDLELETESFEEDAEGKRTSKRIPLLTYFPVSLEAQGNAALDSINQKGILKSLHDLRVADRFNETDQNVASILRAKAQKAYWTAVSTGSLDEKVRMSAFLGEIVALDAKIGTVTGRSQGARTEAARGKIAGQAVGDLKISQILTELERQAHVEYEQETGEKLDLPTLLQEAEILEAEVTKLTPAPAKEGQPPTAVSPEQQKKFDEAKIKYDKTISKIKNAEAKIARKFEGFTEEDQATLKDLYDLLDVVQPGTVQTAVATHIFELESKQITKDSSPDAFERVYNFYRSNLLSGPSTQFRNALGNFSSALSNVVGLAGSGDVQGAAEYTKQWLKATPDSFREMGMILQGKKSGRFKFGEKITDRKGNVKELSRIPPVNNPVRLLREGDPGEAAKAGLTFIQNAMYRLLNAQDAFFYRNAQSAMAHLAEQVAVKNESDPAKRKELIENNVFNNKERQEEISKKVNRQAATLKKAGIELSDTEISEAIFEGMQQSLSERTRDIADKHAEKSIFVNDPQGVMGVMYRGIEFLTDELAVDIGGTKVKPFKFLMPFTRVASNVTSHLMEFTPVGIGKGLINNSEAAPGLFNHALTDIDARMVLGRGLAGTTLMAAFMGIAFAYKDDERPFIEFYGYPPKGKYREWKAKGIDSYSMRVGDSIFPLQGTSLAIIPAILGGAMENIKAGSDPLQVAQTAAVASLGAVSTMSFLKPAGDLFEYIMGSKEGSDSESGSASKRRSNFLKGQADTLASGFIPASGFLNNVGRWMNESPTESYNNLSAKVLGDMPFARDLGIGKPQLDMFGDPITSTLQQRFFAGLTPHTIKTDPKFLWMQETGYSIPDQGPILRLTKKEEKARFADLQLKIFGYSDVLSEEQSREVLEISGPEIKRFIESVSRQPRFQVKSEAGQKYINEYVNNVRTRAKLQVLTKGREQLLTSDTP